MKQSTVAIITARGGSKGIPRKNIKELQGKPLIFYTIRAALHSALIDDCYVTTDDAEIAAVSKLYGANVIERPTEISGDEASSYDAVHHALEHLKRKGKHFEYVVLLQPTSPMRKAEHITKALHLLFNSGVNCVVSVCQCEHHPYKTFIDKETQVAPLIDFKSLETPRQVLPKSYRLSGAIYALRTEPFLRAKRFVVSPFHLYEMTPEDSVDVDTELDLQLCELLMDNREGC